MPDPSCYAPMPAPTLTPDPPPIPHCANSKAADWINAHGGAATDAAKSLGIAGIQGEADILALSAVESAWGTFQYKDQKTGQMKTGYPGAWFGMHGHLPGEAQCAPISGGGCVSEFSTFGDAATAFVNSWQGQLVNGKSDPSSFFKTIQIQRKFGVNKEGNPVAWFYDTTTSVEASIENCLEVLGLMTISRQDHESGQALKRRLRVRGAQWRHPLQCQWQRLRINRPDSTSEISAA